MTPYEITTNSLAFYFVIGIALGIVINIIAKKSSGGNDGLSNNRD